MLLPVLFHICSPYVFVNAQEIYANECIASPGEKPYRFEQLLAVQESMPASEAANKELSIV